MFELTNEQRRCFAISLVLDSYKKVEAPSLRRANYRTYAYLDGQRVVKVVQVSEMPENEWYYEFDLDESLSEDYTRILPKTDKGKSRIFSASVLEKSKHIGMSIYFRKDTVRIDNNNTDQCYYNSSYNPITLDGLGDFSKWVEDWCRGTGEKELRDIDEFSKRKRIRQKFAEGDFFRYRLDRGLYGYGRILVDYDKMRRDGIPFWSIFMGKPLCVAIYHVATEDSGLSPQQLAGLKMLPSQIIMDDIFYYGECEIIGNMPIADDEDNYTIHYGRAINFRERDSVFYQCGKCFRCLEDAEMLYKGFTKNSIGRYLVVELPILRECIKANSNEPYWSMIKPWRADEDLRNPKFKEELRRIEEQMGVR